MIRSMMIAIAIYLSPLTRNGTAAELTFLCRRESDVSRCLFAGFT